MRKEKSIKNFITSVIPYIILLILGFFRIDYFIKYLGDEIYALNSLFYQIFIYLSLAEAGAGAYIIQLYYKCFADKNKKEIINIFHSSKKLLKKVALIVFAIGIVASFLLKILTNNSLSLIYMQIVFLLFVFKNIIDYLYTAPKCVIEADQKAYLINFRFYSMKVVEYLVDIILLYLGFDYIIILIGEIGCKFLSYGITNKRIYKEYPYLKNKPTKEVSLKGITNMLWHRVSEAIHYNTDIIITSAFLSPLLVAIYSSYNYVTKYLTDFIDMFVSAITPSMGNSIYSDDEGNTRKIFEELNGLFLFIASFLSIMVYLLASPFVSEVWLSKKYVIGNMALIFFVLNFFIVVSRKPFYIYRNGRGLFKETKLIVLLEAIVNLVLSFVLVLKYGITGILIATTISMLTTTLWYMPYFIYNKYLKTSSIQYFIKLFMVFILSIFIAYIGNKLIGYFSISNLLSWLLIAVIFGIIIFVILFILFSVFSKDFRDITKKLIGMLKRS